MSTRKIKYWRKAHKRETRAPQDQSSWPWHVPGVLGFSKWKLSGQAPGRWWHTAVGWDFNGQLSKLLSFPYLKESHRAYLEGCFRISFLVVVKYT